MESKKVTFLLGQTLKFILLVSGLFGAASTHAVELEKKPSSPSMWESATYFGFAQTTHRESGVRNANGSLVGLQLSRKLFSSRSLALGLNTIASGGNSSDASFYRLATGPAIHGKIFKDLYLAAKILTYRETINDQEKKPSLRGSGQGIEVQWERNFQIAKTTYVGLGGFWGCYLGRLSSLSESSSRQASFGTKHHIISQSRGFEISLRIGI